MNIPAILLLAALILQTGVSLVQKRRIRLQIDQAEELLTDFVEHYTRADTTASDWKRWRDICEKSYRDPFIDRLYGKIWEVTQICREREEGNRSEQVYLKDLMQDISHQLKTPLSSLTVFVDIFARHLDKTDIRERELTRQAKIQIERMSWLIHGMLKLAQVESGLLTYQYEILPLRLTIERCIEMQRVKWMEKELQIIIEESKAEGSRTSEILLRQDAGWLQEAYGNILKNAIEYAPAGSSILIRIQETSMAVTLSIRDSGRGIPVSELPKIFNRFYRVSEGEYASVRAAGEATEGEYASVRAAGEASDSVGIGLSLAKSIIEAQGGILTVYSRTGEASYTEFVSTFLTDFRQKTG